MTGTSATTTAGRSAYPRRLTVTVIAICWITIIIDGFDVVVYGAIVPSLLADSDFGLNPASVGFIGSLTIIGMFFGSLMSGPLTDRFGRKRMLLVFIPWFSITTALCALAPSPEVLGLLRFISGVALGGVLPTAMALIAEYSSPRQRNFVYGIVFTGFPIGGILAALSGLVIIPAYGWRGMFLLGTIGLAILPFAALLLPESVSYLLSRGKRQKAESLAQRHGFKLADTADAVEDAPAGSVSAKTKVSTLFTGGRARTTIALWAASFFCLFMIYGLNTWLPQIMQSSGYSLGSSLTVLLVYNLGAVLGLMSISRLADRFDSRRVIIPCFLFGAAAIALLSVPMPTVVLYAVLILGGATVLGTQAFINAWVSKASPTPVRATALGWTLAAGRLGSVLAPTVLGLIVASSAPVSWNFYAIAIPGLLGAIVIAALTRNKRPQATPASEASSREAEVEKGQSHERQ